MGRLSDRAAALVAALSAAIMIAQQVGGKATRDALFLSAFSAHELPAVMVSSAIFSLASIFVAARGIARFGPDRFVPFTFLANGVVFFLEWVAASYLFDAVAVAVYLHIATVGAVVISGYWSVINERFNPHSAKRHVTIIGTGAALGGVIGGLVAERTGVFFDARTMLLILAAMNLVCSFGVSRVGRRQRPRQSDPPEEIAPSAFAVLRETPYLRNMGIVVALTAIAATMLDFSLKSSADATFDESDLLSFFALFYTVTSIAAFFLQSTLTPLFLRRIGLGGTLAVLPISVIACSALAMALPQLIFTAIARGADAVFTNSLYRAGYELLFMPLPNAKKRPTKTIVDVGFMRLGDAIGSGALVLILIVTSDLRLITGVAIVVSILAVIMVMRLHRGYVNALETSLRSGLVRLSEHEVVDATTRRITESTVSRARRVPDPTRSETDVHTSLTPNGHHPEATLLSISELLSNDEGSMRRVLTHRPVALNLAPYVIPLLADERFAAEATRALGSIATKIPGQLADVLVDHEQPLALRRRLPRILGLATDRRAANGLFQGLDDSSFEVRFRCARALLRLVSQSKELEFPRAEVFRIVEHELERSRRNIESRRRLQNEPNDSITRWIDHLLRRRSDRSLELVFTILGLIVDHEMLSLSLRALRGVDIHLRGTALEYLDNVLPETVLRGLRPHIGEADVTTSPRTREEIVDELIRSLGSLQ